MSEGEEHTLEFLLAFDGRIHWLDYGYSLQKAMKAATMRSSAPSGCSKTSFARFDVCWMNAA